MVIALPQINLYLTDFTNDNKGNVVFQHDCLHIATAIERETDPYQIISYCLTEWPSKLNIQQNNFDQNFTFAELYQQNITSQQLYLWSAPIDVIEHYQLYLNQLSTSKNISSLASQLFYNCTLPRFGPFCQYSFDIYQSHHSSLNEIIYEFYQQEYEPTTLTCYIHLECNRGPKSICLDWSEICDGFVDCQNGIDEKHCWQLEYSECEDNAFRCTNGQCISKTFLRDGSNSFECLDRTDEIREYDELEFALYVDVHSEPTFVNEDILCLSRKRTESMVKLTSSCFEKRGMLLNKLLLSDKPNSVSDICWLAVTCELLAMQGPDPRCPDLCSDRTCRAIINETCPYMLNVPAGPLAFGHIFFIYTKEFIENLYPGPPPPEYVCYNDQLCDGLHPSKSLISFNNARCRRPVDFPLMFNSFQISRGNWHFMYISPLYYQLYQCNKVNYNHFDNCTGSNMYKCINSSKCISKHRLCDAISDCHLHDDEECSQINDSCSIYGLKNLFKCTTKNICISSILINDGLCHCGLNEYGLCDDEIMELDYIRKHISFSTICDGFTELMPVIIDGQNETDETECEYWQCDNTYTRCDGFWNCLNGADEVDCDPLPLLKCPSHNHICVSPTRNEFMCLPLEKANDSIIDCLGGTDEPKLCRSNKYESSNKNFYCITHAEELCIDTSSLCSTSKCQDKSDKQFCDTSSNRTFYYSICGDYNKNIRSKLENFFCERQDDTSKPKIVNFALGKLTNSSDQLIEHGTNAIISHLSIQQTTTLQHQQFCHRGLPLRVWSNSDENVTNITCLCPPTFYGDQCQYQNQRVSLTIRFQAYSGSTRTLFALLVSLIDDSDERIIHSHQQLTYLYIQHCQTKFNIYLLYSTRPKLSTRNYSIHIDIYEKILFIYRGSLLIPLNYPFLPVYRIGVQLNIPRVSDTIEICSDQKCIHGQCTKYSNDPHGTSFCRCDRGWSGKYCTIPHTCTCSPDSLCTGVSANNRSICVCPLNKWGSQCLLDDVVCHSDENATCQNGGQCIAIDENMVSDKKFICLCSHGFSGKRCEKADNKIIVSFHKDIILPPTILVHFIRVIDKGPPENGSTYKTIPIDQKSVIILWSPPFHVAFVELFDNNFYLITVQKSYKRSLVTSKTINSSDRCAYISEVLNETIVNFHPLRRIKYYHLPCQKRSSSLLSCFYDDSLFCLCNDFGRQRVANCFEFNRAIKHDCFGQSSCENGAQCLQDKPTCPQTSICVCPECFCGTRCQFSSSLFGLSLDAILGYHIQPHVSIYHQSHIVKVSIAFTIIMTISGLVNGVLSLIIFKNKEPRKIGSGLYLLGSSITTLFTMTIFALKFWILISAQITSMTNRSFLQFQCTSMDFLLRFGINMDQWLNACVTMERAFTTIKGIWFNKQKSKQMAKYIIVFLLFLNIITIIHDPIYRHLIDDVNNEDEKRIWCIVTYSSRLQKFNFMINLFHFFLPFLINLISAFIIIIKIAQQRTRVQADRTYRQLLYEQFREHSHLFLAPLLLIILAVPRLIISLTSGCMKSNNDSWLFLTGYFISFIPPTLTFVVFVLPSKLYKDEFYKISRKFQRKIRSRIYPIS